MITHLRWRWAVLAIAIVKGAAAQVDPASDPAIQPLASNLEFAYQLHWSDEFEASELDMARWQYRTDSKLWSTQQPGNVSVADGLASIELKKESVGGKSYTGGGIISRQAFRYGYYEARVKVPSGEGWHTSFWMMDHHHQDSDSSQLELDPLENDSVDLTRYSVDLHQWRTDIGHLKRFRYIYPEQPLDQFHVYGVEFTTKGARYYFNGELVHSTTSLLQRFRTREEAAGREPQERDFANLEHNDMNIWFTAIAAKLAATTQVDDSMLPAQAQCDYVRYFKPLTKH